MAQAIYEVVAGIIPGTPDPKHTKRFGATGITEHADGLHHMLDAWHQAVAYATYLQLLCANGMEVNWVRIDFIWP